MSQTTVLHVGGLHWATSEHAIESTLWRREGVEMVEANAANQSATVTYDPDRTSVAELADGDLIDVTAVSKGKGFAGAMKRHGFAGVGASHGAHKNHRKPGSVGGASTPGRVFKGQRMPGRMGAVRQTTMNLTLHGIDVENNLLLIKGAVPGSKGQVVLVRSAVKGA